MRAWLRGLVVALALVSVAVHARASGPDGDVVVLSAPLAQGDLVRGRVPAGADLKVDGRAVRVAGDGRFVFGLGRDASDEVTVTVTLPDGAEKTQTLPVAARDWQVERIDGLPESKVSLDEKTLARVRRESAQIHGARKHDSDRAGAFQAFRWPVTGRLSGVFGSQRVLNGKPRSPHRGVDVAAPAGTPVVAPSPGVVTLLHRDMFFTGVTVMLDHGFGVSSVYAHLADATVADGEAVAAGEVIGHVGMSGRATGPHLHWGVYWFETPVDPEALTPPME